MDALIINARARIAAGELPAGHDVHAEGGPSRGGALCLLCGEAIAPGSAEVELRWDERDVLLHPRCHSAWIAAVREFAGH